MGRLAGRLSRYQAWRIIAEAASRCRLEPCVMPHSWRKTMAARLYRDTRSLLVVKHVLQHRHVSTSVRGPF